MSDAKDMDLVREFARDNSETAFTELVQRHINLVYSVALRCTGDTGDAQDVMQAVFIILARKAAGLRERTLLTGWLYETTRFTATRLLRTNARRHAREQEAYMQSTLNDAGLSRHSRATADTAAIWRQLSPHLEAAMSKLAERDRELLVLRFYENKSGPEAAALLGIREDTAYKRVTRALEKLRKFFVKRGVTLTATAIAGAVSANSVQAAPVVLAKTVTTVAIVKGSIATASTLTLVKGTLNFMAWAKLKMGTLAGVGILLAAATVAVSIKYFNPYNPQTETAIVKIESKLDAVYKPLPQAMIVPTKFPGTDRAWASDGDHMLGWNQPIKPIVDLAFWQTENYRTRTIIESNLPQDKYDFNSDAGDGSAEALRQELKTALGIVGIHEMRETDVLLLKVKKSNTPGLKLPVHPSHLLTYPVPQGQLFFPDQTVSTTLAMYLENYFNIPVFDQTGLTSRYDISLTWDATDRVHRNFKGMKQALLDQLGLELVPTNMPIEMLVVEKVK